MLDAGTARDKHAMNLTLLQTARFCLVRPLVVVRLWSDYEHLRVIQFHFVVKQTVVHVALRSK